MLVNLGFPAGVLLLCVHNLYPDLSWPQDQCPGMTLHLFRKKPVTTASTSLTLVPKEKTTHFKA